MALTDLELERYSDDGYVWPVEIVSSADMASMRPAILRDLLEDTPASRRTYGFRLNRDTHLYSRPIFDIVTHPALAACLVQLLGPNVLLWRTTAFLKPPEAARDKPDLAVTQNIDWHQGLDFTRPESDLSDAIPAIGRSRQENARCMPRCVTAWIAVDDVDPSMGSLRFVAGSNKLGPRGYVAVGRGNGLHGRGIQAAWSDVIDPAQAEAITVAAGSCVMFDNFVFHGSPPNHSTRRRLGFACRYVAAATPVYDKGDHDFGLDLRRWGCVVVAGEPDRRINKVLDPALLQLG